MKLITKLQLKTLLYVQIIGFALSLFVGSSIVILSYNLYHDIKPIFEDETNIFDENTIILSKKISIFKSLDKKKIYFSEKEIKSLKEQSFTEKVSFFNFATYKIKAYTSGGGINIPGFQTDLFFESVPDEIMDIDLTDWKWIEEEKFIPIVVPESYLKLYNFGFAESQGLPVLSKNTIKQVSFNIELYGNNKREQFSAKIVGFSKNINSILVPNDFLEWSNGEFGNNKEKKVNRIILHLKNINDKNLLEFFNKKNYSINGKSLNTNKLSYLFKFIFYFLIAISLLIIVLSINFILLSLNLVIQKNKELISNLYNIGYNTNAIIKFYFLVMNFISSFVIIMAFILNNISRNMYLKILNKYFEVETQSALSMYFIFVIIIVLAVVYYYFLKRKIESVIK